MTEKRLIDANALHKRIEMNLRASNPFTIEECCYKDALNSVDEAPTIDPESLRPKTSMKYDALTRTVTCRNCSGEAKIGEYDNPEDFRYCPFCGFKVEDLTYDVY